jgi:hypothetical protein
MVAGAPAFVITVLSVILKVRECSFPAIVKVFARASTAEIIPWNGIARAFVASVVVLDESDVVLAGELVVLAAGEDLAFGEAEATGLGVGDADFLAAPFAAKGRQHARAAAHAVMERSLFFIGRVVFGVLVVSGSMGERNGGCRMS